MDFKANCGVWGNMFGVPCIVADNLLKLATGEQIKVLLYLLRNSGRNVSAEEISVNTGVSVQQAEDAVLFWQQVNVLSPEVPAISAPKSIMTVPEVPVVKPEPAVTASAPAAVVPPQPAKPEPQPPIRKREELKPSEISVILSESPHIAELFKAAEATFGSVNHTMQNSLIWMTNYLGLKAEVILTLLMYCKQNDKYSVAYMEKIAITWAEKEINTLEAAQEETERLSSSNDFTNLIMKMFEMKRRPTTKQLEIAEQWRSANYPHELIHLAYEKTIEQIERLSFEYINSILVAWAANGYKTEDDVKRSEDEYKKNKKQSTPENSGKSGSESFDADKYSFVINNI